MFLAIPLLDPSMSQDMSFCHVCLQSVAYTFTPVRAIWCLVGSKTQAASDILALSWRMAYRLMLLPVLLLALATAVEAFLALLTHSGRLAQLCFRLSASPAASRTSQSSRRAVTAIGKHDLTLDRALLVRRLCSSLVQSGTVLCQGRGSRCRSRSTARRGG